MATRLDLARLPDDLRGILTAATAVGAETGLPTYLVGGLVRDLARGEISRDLDLMVEGPVAAFAPRLAERIGGRVRAYSQFLTALVETPNGEVIDIARCRRESYAALAVLPQVEPGSLAEDLARRDFAVNTLAWRLFPPGQRRVIDLHGGLADLAAGRLRILHPRSFHDDPTRLFRGVRFAVRLGFRFDAGTESCLRQALADGALAALSGSRLRAELELTFAERELVLPALSRLWRLGVLRAIEPALLRRPGPRACVAPALEAWAWYQDEPRQETAAPRLWFLVLLALTGVLDWDERTRLADRLALAGAERERLVSAANRVAEALDELSRQRAPSVIEAVLADFPAEELLWLWSLGGADRQGVERYVREIRPFELAIRGNDLLAAGLAPGPAIGEALRAARRARLDGEISAAEELSYALDHAKRAG